MTSPGPTLKPERWASDAHDVASLAPPEFPSLPAACPRGQSSHVHRGRSCGDTGAVRLGALVTSLAAIAVVSVLGYDVISITTTNLRVRDDAEQAAQVGYQTLRDSGSQDRARAAVREWVADHGDVLTTDSPVITGTQRVDVSLVRHAPTLVAHLVPATSPWCTSAATATAQDPFAG